MPRDYKALLRGEGVFVPRWILVTAAALGLLWVAVSILTPPTWVVQRLDSPDGERSARLLRTHYSRHHFVVQLKDGLFWQTAHYSRAYAYDYSRDLHERLFWSEDSDRVFLTVDGRVVWGYDWVRGVRIPPGDLEAAPLPFPERRNQPERSPEESDRL
jgi:hypothetical protein